MGKRNVSGLNRNLAKIKCAIQKRGGLEVRIASSFLQGTLKNQVIASKGRHKKIFLFRFLRLLSTSFITIALLFVHPWSRRRLTKAISLIRQGSSLSQRKRDFLQMFTKVIRYQGQLLETEFSPHGTLDKALRFHA